MKRATSVRGAPPRCKSPRSASVERSRTVAAELLRASQAADHQTATQREAQREGGRAPFQTVRPSAATTACGLARSFDDERRLIQRFSANPDDVVLEDCTSDIVYRSCLEQWLQRNERVAREGSWQHSSSSANGEKEAAADHNNIPRRPPASRIYHKMIRVQRSASATQCSHSSLSGGNSARRRAAQQPPPPPIEVSSRLFPPPSIASLRAITKRILNGAEGGDDSSRGGDDQHAAPAVPVAHKEKGQ